MVPIDLLLNVLIFLLEARLLLFQDLIYHGIETAVLCNDFAYQSLWPQRQRLRQASLSDQT